MPTIALRSNGDQARSRPHPAARPTDTKHAPAYVSAWRPRFLDSGWHPAVDVGRGGISVAVVDYNCRKRKDKRGKRAYQGIRTKKGFRKERSGNTLWGGLEMRQERVGEATGRKGDASTEPTRLADQAYTFSEC
jgi:hypothetical protein